MTKNSCELICVTLKKDGAYYEVEVSLPFGATKTYENKLTHEELRDHIKNRPVVLADYEMVPMEDNPEYADCIRLYLDFGNSEPRVSVKNPPKKGSLVENLTFLGEVTSPMKGFVYEIYAGNETFYSRKKGVEDMYGTSKDKHWNIQNWILQQDLPEKFVVLEARLREERRKGWSGFWNSMLIGMCRGEIIVTNDGKHTYIHDPQEEKQSREVTFSPAYEGGGLRMKASERGN